MEERWALSIRDQCQAAGVPFFFKQWGGVRKSQAGRDLEQRTHDEYPAITPACPPSAAERARRVRLLKQRFGSMTIAAA
jgi:hypothetical protein